MNNRGNLKWQVLAGLDFRVSCLARCIYCDVQFCPLISVSDAERFSTRDPTTPVSYLPCDNCKQLGVKIDSDLELIAL